MAKRILLTIAMLASRNKAEVRRCLDSLRPIMEKIPSELVIVDTSQDASVHALCLEYTDRVAEFVWCDDFSKARNVSVEMARGEWYLFIDDDEWFVEYDELIDFFTSGKYKDYGCANYIQRNFHDAQGAFYSDSWVSRIIKLYPETKFYSRIHEYIAPQVGKCINLHLVANHTGYIAQTMEAKLKKFERNYPLLLQMMKEEPKRLRWRVQIIQELNNVQKWEELQQFCQESLGAVTNCTDPDDFRDIGTFYAGLLDSQIELKHSDAALAMKKAMQMDKRLSRLCRAYCALSFARLHFQRRECREAEEQLAVYEDAFQYFKKHRSQLEEEEGALLVGTAFDNVCRKRALSLKIGCGLMRGDTSALRENYEELGWGEPVMYVSDDLFPVLVEAMAKMPADENLLRAMQDLWNNREAATKLFAAIEGRREQDEAACRALMRMTARMEGEFWYIWYVKLIVADEDGWDADYQAFFSEFCRRTPDIFATPDILTDIVKRHGGSVEEGYLSVPYEMWKEHLQEYMGKVPVQDLWTTERELLAMKSRENVRYDMAFVWLAYGRAAKGEAFADMEQGLKDYGTRALEFARKYYTPLVFQEYPELLPGSLLAGFYLAKAFEAQGDNQREMAYLDNAAHVDPALSPVIVRYLRERELEWQKRAWRERSEMRQLEKQIKERVQTSLDEKRFAEALEILEQLAMIRPNDLETAKLKLMARIGLLEAH
ncbi:MAG: glycosyltransferase [Agathobacter sp.]|nr:glycosyltransferase [Agathobacter sp.]